MINNLFFHGTLRHRRFSPKKHEFSYQVCMFYFNIEKIAHVFRPYKWISVEKFNFFSFYRKNYLGNKEISLDQAVREAAQNQLGFFPQGKIFLLTNLSCMGYCVNPISAYFIFKQNSDELEIIMLEVTNTPWGEKHSYILNNPKMIKKNIYEYKFKKELHVSPFLGMDYEYRIRLKLDSTNKIVHIDSYKKNQKHFDATLSLKTKENSLQKIGWYPFMTFKVIGAIYWQALKLWFNGATFYPHSKK